VRETALFENTIISNSSKKYNFFDREIFYDFGESLSRLLPESLLEKLKIDYLYLSKTKSELYRDLALSLILFLLFFILFIFLKNFLLIVLGFFSGSLFISKIFIQRYLEDSELEQDSLHFARCLKILTVNTETPLNTGMQLIIQSLPSRMKALKRVITEILLQAEKTSMKQSLLEWKTESENFKDLISMMISVQEGANKKAIKDALISFIKNCEEGDEEKLRNETENLQLYLSGPIILIFLVLMYPMVAAINYMMKGTNFL
jgi:hypothetical protein